MTRPRPAVLAVAAIGLAIAGIVGVNLFDQELTPEARAIFERPPAKFSRESGWALLAGFNAPAGTDPRDYMTARRPVDGMKTVSRPRGDELAVRAPAELLCLPEKMDCVAQFAAQPQFVDDMAADNAVLLARYDELLRSSGLADAVQGLDAWGAFHQGGLVLGVQRIRMSQVGAAAARGRIDAALAWLEADAMFYRRWLEESDTLLSKMLALRAFTRPLLLAGQVARAAPSLSSAQAESLARITAPLTVRQRGLSAAMRSEAAFFAESLDELIAKPREAVKVTGAPAPMADLASRTVRRNATLNFATPLFANWVSLDDVETPALTPAIERNRAIERERLAPDWRWIYNWPGRAITTEIHYDPSEYVWRLRDGDAFAALMRCATLLRSRGIARESAAAFIGADPACVDPYLSRPLAWDEAKSELSFKPANAQNAERFGGANGRVTFAPYLRAG